MSADKDLKQYGWFDGIIEGRRKNDDKLRDGVSLLNASGVVGLDLEVEGGRFSILANDRILSEDSLTEEKRNLFVKALSDLVSGQGPESMIESTLRCTTIEGDIIQETMFPVIEGQLKPVTRERDANDEDRANIPVSVTEGSFIASVMAGDPKVAIAVGAAALLLLFMIIWQSGLISSLARPDAELVDVSSGPFDEMLSLSIESKWGKYKVMVKRGPEYPVSQKDIDALTLKTVTAPERAAVNMVANGEQIYIRLEDGEGKTLVFTVVSLRSLLSNPDKAITVDIPGHMKTKKITAAIDSGKEEK